MRLRTKIKDLNSIVEKAIEKVQVGTDKTAAELALPRLNQELGASLAEVERLKKQSKQPSPAAGCLGFIVSFGPLFIGISIAEAMGPGGESDSKTAIVLSSLVVGIAISAWIILSSVQRQKTKFASALAKAELDADELRKRIAANEQIANS